MSELAGVLLAAGQGARFGGNKGLALLPDGVPMAVRSALNLSAVVSQAVCVVRPGDTALYDLLRERGLTVIVAENAAQGMSASLHAGINALPGVVGWMVALADMPLIKPDTYQQLSAAFTAKQQITMPRLISCGQRQQGHPVIFPARFKSDLLTLSGDKGAKAILQQYAATVQRVSVDDPGILQDFDTRQALERLFI